jgi:hypothetical protein
MVLPQLPHVAFMRALIIHWPSEYDVHTLYTSLLASSIYNSASSPHLRTGIQYGAPWTQVLCIANRIRNCVTIAASIRLPPQASFADPRVRPRDLMQRLCTAASTSTYCQEYIYLPLEYMQGFSRNSEGDAYLELALLISCGYTDKSVLRYMVYLHKAGKLRPYTLGRPAEDLIWCIERWGSGRRRQCYKHNDCTCFSEGNALGRTKLVLRSGMHGE